MTVKEQTQALLSLLGVFKQKKDELVAMAVAVNAEAKALGKRVAIESPELAAEVSRVLDELDALTAVLTGSTH